MRTRRIILILIIGLTAGASFAQGPEFEVFVRPAVTALRGNDIVKNNLDPTVNLSTGLGANYFLKGKSFINFAILYDKKGGRGESHIEIRDAQNQVVGQGTIRNESNFEYITIPVQWGQRFGQKLKYSFGIGVYTGFLLNQETVSKGLGLDSKQDYTDKFRSIDFGLSANLNLNIPIKDLVFIKIGLNDNLGLINVTDVPAANGGTIKHNSLGVLLGFGFRVN